MPSPLLTMRGVQKRFGATTALKSVDLDVNGGEVLALIGENGAGKSTLMKILSGAHTADAGAMTLGGKTYAPRDPLHARRDGVAMIYQELSIAPDLTVMENILLGVEPGSGPFVSWGQMRQRALAALAEAGRHDIDPGARAGSLSVAAQQIVEIARSVALGCRVLVLDEPTSSLTRRDIANLFLLLHKLRNRGLGIVYISHFLEEVREISERYTVLRDGASVGSGKTSEVSNEQIIHLMVGRDVEDLYPRSVRKQGEPILRINSLRGNSKPVDASLTLHRGEVLGIAGLIGAGRTEMLRAIFGLDRVRSGEITMAGFLGFATPATRWAQGIGFLSEDRKNEGLATGLSIGDNITLSRLTGLGPAGLVLPRRRDAASNIWVNRLSIKCNSPRQLVSALSGGNQQKVAIARLLHHDVDVLLFDEPTRGVDIGAKSQIYQVIDDLAAGDASGPRGPRAIIVVSSYLPELLGICDRIAVMSRGVLGPARPVAQWTEHTLMTAAIGSEIETVNDRSN